MDRRSLSKRLRFEIFKRDGFRCVYCGGTPLQSILHVDHVEPVAEGGTDDAFNLVTACESCNLGKGAIRLADGTLPVGATTEEQKDRAELILEYLTVQTDIARARAAAGDALRNYWIEASQRQRGEDGGFPTNMRGRLPGLLEQWPVEKLIEAIDIATSKGLSILDEVKYFYGILRRWRDREKPAEYQRAFAEDRAAARERQAHEEQQRLYDQDWEEALQYERSFGPRHERLREMLVEDPERAEFLKPHWFRDGMIIDGQQIPDDYEEIIEREQEELEHEREAC